MIYPSHGGQNRGEERVDGGNGAELNSFPIRIYVLQPREGTKAMKKREKEARKADRSSRSDFEWRGFQWSSLI